jgi:hypothetical protein
MASRYALLAEPAPTMRGSSTRGINDHDVDHPPVPIAPDVKPPVPTVARSPLDGIVAPASAAGEEWESDRRVELDCRHNVMVSDPGALRAIVSALAGS